MRNCPPKFALNEIEVLDPSVVVAFGLEPRQRVVEMLDVTWTDTHTDWRVGTTVGGRTVIALPHPRAQYGARIREGRRELVAHLGERRATWLRP